MTAIANRICEVDLIDPDARAARAPSVGVLAQRVFRGGSSPSAYLLEAFGYTSVMTQTEMTFGGFCLSDEGLTRDGEPIAIGHRGLALLTALATSLGPVTKSTLMQAAWPDTIVEESNLSVQIAALRKTLGRRDDGQDWIVTVPKVGYRLLRGSVEPAEKRLPTVAVLRFQNLSSVAEQDYLADGVVDELITALSRFRSFAVVARSSSFSWKGRPAGAVEIARSLGVGYLVEGSLRRSGDRLRMAAQLVDGGSGATIWAQTFEGTADQVFEFQDSITAKVAGTIEPLIQKAEIEHSRLERPDSMAAYDLYLRAISLIYKFEAEANREAITLLEKAIAIEPHNGTFHAFAAWALEHRTSIGWSALGPDDRQRALRSANAALELAGSDATILAHCGLTLQLIGQEYERGLLVAVRATDINPNDVVALLTAGVAHMIGGDLREAAHFLNKVIAIDSGNPEAIGVMAHVHFYCGELEASVKAATRAIAINANFVPSYWALIAANAELDRLEEARAGVQALLQRVPGTTLKWARTSPGPSDPKRLERFMSALRKGGVPAS